MERKNTADDLQMQEEQSCGYHIFGSYNSRAETLLESQRRSINRAAPGHFLGQSPRDLVFDSSSSNVFGEIHSNEVTISSPAILDLDFVVELNSPSLDRTLFEMYPRLETDRQYLLNNIIDLNNSPVVTDQESFNSLMSLLSGAVTSDTHSLLEGFEQREWFTVEGNNSNRELSNILLEGSRDLINNNTFNIGRANSFRRNAYTSFPEIHVPTSQEIVSRWFIDLFGLYPATVLTPLYDFFFAHGVYFLLLLLFLLCLQH